MQKRIKTMGKEGSLWFAVLAIVISLLGKASWCEGAPLSSLYRSQAPKLGVSGRAVAQQYRLGACENGDQLFAQFRWSSPRPHYPRLEQARVLCYSARMNWDPANEDRESPPDLVPEYNLLPFGIGQFQNGDTFLGVGLLITEVAALGYGAYQIMDSQALGTSVQKQYKEAQKSDQFDKTELEKWKKQQTKEVARRMQTGETSLKVFGGLWVAGMIQSIWQYRQIQNSYQSRSQRRVYGLSVELNLNPAKISDSMIRASYAF